MNRARTTITQANLSELEEERDLALGALVELDEELASGRLDADEHEALKKEATARAAGALRALQEASAKAAESESSASTSSRDQNEAQKEKPRNRLHRHGTLLVTTAVVCFVAVLGIAVGRFAAVRLPGQTITGTERVDNQQKLAEELVQGRDLVSQGRYNAALSLFGKVLSKSPSQPEALAYEGWLIALTGASKHESNLVEQGRSDISKAIETDPGYPDAHAFLGYILFEDENDLPDALIQFRLFLADKPANALVQRIAPVIDQAFAKAGLPSPIKSQAKKK